MKIITKSEAPSILVGRRISRREARRIFREANAKLLAENPPAKSPKPVVIGVPRSQGIGRLNVRNLKIAYND